MSIILIDNYQQFKDKLKENKIKTVLLGNGFGLSHPCLGDAFKFDHEAVHKKLLKKLKSEPGLRGIKMIVYNDWSLVNECPELYLKELRYCASEILLNSYIENLKERVGCGTGGLNDVPFTCKEFLENFENIFTINYDPLTYNQLFKYFKNNIVDGFSGDALCQECICKRLKLEEIQSCRNGCKITKIQGDKKKKIYYLHGSYYIEFNRETNKLSKKPYSDILETLNLSSENKLPYVVLEDRSEIKSTLTTSDSSENKYLSFCFDKLKKTNGNILLFGLSLANDNHIIKVLCGSQYENIFITMIDDDEGKGEEKVNDISAKFQKHSNSKIITYLYIPKHLIWQEE